MIGSDHNLEFADGARSNLDDLRRQAAALVVATSGGHAEEGGEEAEEAATMEIFEHDATAELPEARRAALLGCQRSAPAATPSSSSSDLLIVSNPPWGKNIGTAEDGEPIVRSLVAQFRGGTTMVLLVNKQTRMALEKMAEAEAKAKGADDAAAKEEGGEQEAVPPRSALEVLKVIKLGGVEAVLLSA